MSVCITCYGVKKKLFTLPYPRAKCSMCDYQGLVYDWNKFFDSTDMKEISQGELSRVLQVPILPVTLYRRGSKIIHVDTVWKRIIFPEKFVKKIWTYDNLSYLQLVTAIEPDNYSYTVGGIIIDLEIP